DEIMVANIAAGPSFGREGGAPLDRAVCLDAEREAPGAAGSHVPAGHGPSEQRFIGTEVSDVIAWPEPNFELVAAALQALEKGKELDEVVRLQQNLGFVGGAAHGD